MQQEAIAEMEARFRRVSRGRAVSVTFEQMDFLLAKDYVASYDLEANSFRVTLRRGGCFEGAYRCLERFIEAEAEGLDGVVSVPSGHLDLRYEMYYWMFERQYDQFRSDLNSAIDARVEWLDRTRPGEGVPGEIVLEARIRALTGFSASLAATDVDVRRAVLSPATLAFLKEVSPAFADEGG